MMYGHTIVVTNVPAKVVIPHVAPLGKKQNSWSRTAPNFDWE